MKGNLSLPPLQVIESWDEQTRMLSEIVRASLPRDRVVDVLEAGCGTRWSLDLTGVDFRLTGVDLDRHALDIRMREHGDLNEVIYGDLRTVEFPPDSFDLVYSAFVLEHVDGAEGVVDNFVRWLRPGGLLVLRIPDRDSVFGFATRTLPFWCHVLYKKYVQGVPDAGKPGHDPYPTFYDLVVSRRGINEYCARRGLGIDLEFADNNFRHRLAMMKPIVIGVTKLIELCSLGRLPSDHSGLAYVIRKHGEPRPQQARVQDGSVSAM